MPVLTATGDSWQKAASTLTPGKDLAERVAAHLRHHIRFYTAVLGGSVYWAVARDLATAIRFIAAGDLFFLLYLLLAAARVLRGSASKLREDAAYEDEGIFLVVVIALAAIGSCFASIFTLLNQAHKPAGISLMLALVCAPLGWLMLHTLAAFHYANLYYTSSPGAPAPPDFRPLFFPGGEKPNAWDFLYFAFVVGMTTQVSDVQVLSTKMRRATLGHGVVSFFFNTVLIAMAVNAAVALAA